MVRRAEEARRAGETEEAKEPKEPKGAAGLPRPYPLPDPCLVAGALLLAAAPVRGQGRIRSLADPSPEPSRASPAVVPSLGCRRGRSYDGRNPSQYNNQTRTDSFIFVHRTTHSEDWWA
ncbi:hypothetical protein San01_09110 [Streptomyces angustmyceticus]|uniref:Uncharacterized protein n=1 Tax=Streptomyces angustmyceticus TaxID=285578 RepID=A0A5J4L6P9_9ACTN|nr:hypothetical protein San01_09110 [Streptomyces angustmyceticus]